ncbi:hypothetical protein TCAL_02766 [Tigriopus californicus]|uniref:Mitochondrial enolase superfamily member 1 n=1 Tax=Tigriopus californicus TaxID=6832 RepID=A0A553NQG9_TIGCA|nr:mitochondrial enolase superfamily member 1-like [Tigriopus californicus]TRY67692.1 hypothetical protein TCAL_02766 [Tigriopus californicus]|eukprot:TCALIF_02766-PA protein Name:"Similar to ENOSF1 Mitochondrial enolase superfamily member 1 (Homo sapiens)" AED:0.11 eAED:0.11 QI:0/0/0/1/1/1/7/0/458
MASILNKPKRIIDLDVRDIRFPTSLTADGSDATHPDPDYSCVYVRLYTDDDNYVGCGLTFTIGRGNELVKHAVDSLRFLVVRRFIEDIQENMACWVNDLANESQLRWVGPEKGVIHLAMAAIVNAFWDLWGKIAKKPVWKLLSEMSPERIISLINFKYINDYLSKEEALAILKKNEPFKRERELWITKRGFPAYTTQVGWLGYDDKKLRENGRKFLRDGFTAFKMKVGSDIEDDKRRLRIIREVIGPNNKLMVDANQKWGVQEAIDWMNELAQFNIHWIEEPTSPDDVLGHLKVSQALEKHGIGVATGEMCQNRVMFKQFLQAGALQFCQIDSARMGGLNDVLAVYLMASKAGIPVCPHSGGVGLCEMVQHLQMFDYVVLSGSIENRLIEFIDHLHEHFEFPPKLGRARYFPPMDYGYSTEMKYGSIRDYEYPEGATWKRLLDKGQYRDPSLEFKKYL